MKLIIPLLIGLISWQARNAFRHYLDSRRQYDLARNYADKAGKPLLIVGGPYGSSPLRQIFRWHAHGAGDYCVDIKPGACAGAPRAIEADIRHIPLPTKSMGAVLASHVLEHLPTVADCVASIAELERVADKVYIAWPGKSSLIAWLHPGHHLWVKEEHGTVTVEQR